MRRDRIELYAAGAQWVAHRVDAPGHDCADDESLHGVSDHPTAALRALLRLEDLDALRSHR
jgi:hypothetical protein